MKKSKILYVDDEQMNLTVFKYAFMNEFEIFLASSATEGIKILESEDIELIISDQIMPETTGIEFLSQAYKMNPFRKHILLTGHTDFSNVVDAINKAKVFYFVDKPFDATKLKEYIHEGLELYQQRFNTSTTS